MLIRLYNLVCLVLCTCVTEERQRLKFRYVWFPFCFGWTNVMLFIMCHLQRIFSKQQAWPQESTRKSPEPDMAPALHSVGGLEDGTLLEHGSIMYSDSLKLTIWLLLSTRITYYHHWPHSNPVLSVLPPLTTLLADMFFPLRSTNLYILASSFTHASHYKTISSMSPNTSLTPVSSPAFLSADQTTGTKALLSLYISRFYLPTPA